MYINTWFWEIDYILCLNENKSLSDAGLQDPFFFPLFSPLSFVCTKIQFRFEVMFLWKKTFLSHRDFINTGRHDNSAEIESVFVILNRP